MPDDSTPSDSVKGRIPRLRRRAHAALGSRRLIARWGIAVTFLIAGGLLAALVVERPKAPGASVGKAGIKTVDPPAASDRPLQPLPPQPLPPDDEPETTPHATGHSESGEASYYGQELAGNPTASGERFDPVKLTAAHPTLPLGARLRVTNLRNGTSVVVRVNDRGPFAKRRILDLSYAAAQQIGMVRTGTAPVRIERVQ